MTHGGACFRGWLLAWAIWFSIAPVQAEPEPGLRVSFLPAGQAGATPDVTVFRHLALTVPEGEAATVFLAPGPFRSVWEGYLTVPLRDDYRFRVLARGKVVLRIGDEVVIDSDGNGEWGEPTDEIRLKKGPNPVQVTYESPASGEALLRVSWASPDFLFEPIGAEHLAHDPSPASQQSQILREGRRLFAEYRCDACHDEREVPATAEPRAGVPLLKGIGGRRTQSWLTEWLLNPQGWRHSARMPKLFQGADARSEASAAAAYLVSLKPERTAEGIQRDFPSGDAAAGQELFAALHCATCHSVDSTPPSDVELLWLGAIGKKYSRSELVSFLQNPNRHYPKIRMPQFPMSVRERADLAAFLLQDAVEGAEVGRESPEADLVARGKGLVAARGCVQCHHDLAGGDGLAVKPRRKIANPNAGCLDRAHAASSTLPQFVLGANERGALQAFVKDGMASLDSQVARETVHDLRTALRCDACHGEIEGVPPYDILGAKLTPEWMEQLFQGNVFYKPRPWLAARMPAFPEYASVLAKGLVHNHGFPSQTPEEAPIDHDLAELGRQMISPLGGFSCVSCHGAAELKPTQVFESEGINFEFSGERLQKEYYLRWLFNPVRIDPASKMPVYFDAEGYSPLFDVLDGDADRQLDAIWQYLRLGADMVPPAIE